MIFARTRILAALLASAAFASPLALPASASQLNIQPLLISLSRASSSSSLRIENNGTEEVRLQIKGFAWNEQDKEDVALTPTDDLIVFPSLMTLKPGEHRSIRIGAIAPAEAVEKSYRVQIVELAAPPTEGSPLEAMTIHLHSRITIPVFLPPLVRDKKHDELAGVAAHAKTLDVSVTNPGNTHSLVHAIRIVAKDDAGVTLAVGTAQGWYVLPGVTRSYPVQLPPNVCARIKSVDLDIETDGPPIHTSAAPQAECAG